MSAPTSHAAPWHIETLLRLGDNALVLAQRLSEWCGHGPALEEDIAMANIGLDLIGQARLLLSHAGALEGAQRDEDSLAYFRDAHQYRNWSALELPNALSGDNKHDDYAVTIMRNMLFSAWAIHFWQQVSQSSDSVLASIAQKAVKESAAHWRHASAWTIRFGDGTEVSNQKINNALERIWPYTREWFGDDDTDRAAAKAGLIPLPSSLYEAWSKTVGTCLTHATLQLPETALPQHAFVSRGKVGEHTEYLSYLLSEMQSLARAHPGARW